MTTTISKHDLQQHQQNQLQLQLQQQQIQHQQQRSTILLKNSTNTNLLINNTANTTATTTTTAKANTFQNTPSTVAIAKTTTATTTTGLDSATVVIQIDSLNNNNTNLSATTTTTTAGLAKTAPASPTNLVHAATQGSLNNNSTASGGNSPDGESPNAAQPKSQKRRSLLNFKSLDFHIKSLYSGLRNGHKPMPPQCSVVVGNANGSGTITDTATATPTTTVNNRMPPYLKIDSADAEEAENLLLDYPQSPYSSRRNSSHDDNRSSSQLLHINRYEASRSQASSPSPYFLSPYATGSGNIRRSSTSDIQRSGTSSASDSRRPSTSDLLRKARERRGTEARMGRSVSHGGLPRGGFRSGCAGGGRRTSIAF